MIVSSPAGRNRQVFKDSLPKVRTDRPARRIDSLVGGGVMEVTPFSPAYCKGVNRLSGTTLKGRATQPTLRERDFSITLILSRQGRGVLHAIMKKNGRDGTYTVDQCSSTALR